LRGPGVDRMLFGRCNPTVVTDKLSHIWPLTMWGGFGTTVVAGGGATPISGVPRLGVNPWRNSLNSQQHIVWESDNVSCAAENRSGCTRIKLPGARFRCSPPQA
jgi:hypothetical protein